MVSACNPGLLQLGARGAGRHIESPVSNKTKQPFDLSPVNRVDAPTSSSVHIFQFLSIVDVTCHLPHLTM